MSMLAEVLRYAAENPEPRFANMDVQEFLPGGSGMPYEVPFRPRSLMDAGVLKTMSSAYEGMKPAVLAALPPDPRGALEASRLRGFIQPNTNILGLFERSTMAARPSDVFIRRMPNLSTEPHSLEAVLSRQGGDSVRDILETLVHEMVHSRAGHDEKGADGGELYDRLLRMVMSNPDVRRNINHYEKSIPKDYFPQWGGVR